MPRDLIRARTHDRDRSLGWLALAWIEHFVVHGPGDVQGDPVRHGDEYAAFIVDCYALDDDGKLLYDSAFLSRPKGCDKSGLAARFALFEAFGPCRFAGWAKGGEVYRDPWGLGFKHRYEPGEPLGRPVRVPFIRCMATEENQTGLVYDTVRVNLTTDGTRLARIPGLDCGLTRTLLPGGGEITPSTASSSAKDGGKETFVAFDETHLYDRPELRDMYDTVTRNIRKRKKSAGTWYLETTTMFAVGADSVAERTYQLAGLIRDQKVKRERLLFDHRFGECEDLADEKALRAGITEAYGDAMEWNDLDGIVDEFYDPRKSTNDSRRFFLNAPGAADDAWLTEPDWTGCAAPDKAIARRDPVTLGFDGSRKRTHSVTDATALIGCRVSDGHLFVIKVWEQPPGPAGEGWEVPRNEVDATVRQAFKDHNVVGFFADPAKWETWVASWEATFGPKLKVKSSQAHPIEWWMTGGRVTQIVRALERFLNAVIDRELTHDGDWVLRAHALNARRRLGRSGVQVAKENPESARKIDAVVAAVLAHECRVQAVAAGIGKKKSMSAPRRIG